MHPAVVPPTSATAALAHKWRQLARLRPSPRTAYVLRSLVAAWLALTTAYLLELDAPYAAASSVLLVISPSQGAVMGKGVWRVLGTLAGMLAAVVLMSAFSQMPWLFLLGFGLWLGLCVAAMTLLRHFPAYGATLAGYTVGLAVYGALEQPGLAFASIMARGSSVLVGVICLALVAALFSSRQAERQIASQLHRLAAAVAASLAADHAANAASRQTAAACATKRMLLLDIYRLDDMLALGQAESAEVVQFAAAARHAMASLCAALASSPMAGLQNQPGWLAALTRLPTLGQAWRTAGLTIERGPEEINLAMQGLQNARASLFAQAGTPQALKASGYACHAAETSGLAYRDKLIEQIDDYLVALESICLMHRPGRPARQPVIPFHRDATAAMQNGTRAMLIVILGGAFWILTGWPHGSMMLAGLAAACALLSTAPNPGAGAVAFIKGTVAAVPLAWLCSFVVLPGVQGLPLLLLILGLFWLPGIYATTVPRYSLAGVAYLVAFTTLAAAGNPMRYDLALFLNASAAWILATCFTLLGFQLLLPRNLAHDTSRLIHRIRQAPLDLLRGRQTHCVNWAWRQQHRLVHLAALTQAQPTASQHALEDAQASLHLGQDFLRLRQWLKQAPRHSPLRQPVIAAMQGMARRADAPLQAARHARRAACALLRVGSRTAATDAAPQEQKQTRAHSNSNNDNPSQDQARTLAMTLIRIALSLEMHAAYFSARNESPNTHAQ